MAAIRFQLKAVVCSVAGAGLALGSSDETRAADPRNGVAETVAKARTAPLLDTHGGVRLFYKEWGTGEPVLFVHSWAMNSDLWQYQMLHLANQGLRCIAYDQRGHGRSSDPGID